MQYPKGMFLFFSILSPSFPLYRLAEGYAAYKLEPYFLFGEDDYSFYYIAEFLLIEFSYLLGAFEYGCELLYFAEPFLVLIAV